MDNIPYKTLNTIPSRESNVVPDIPLVDPKTKCYRRHNLGKESRDIMYWDQTMLTRSTTPSPTVQSLRVLSRTWDLNKKQLMPRNHQMAETGQTVSSDDKVSRLIPLSEDNSRVRHMSPFSCSR